MNADFPRILTLLRKERKMTQKDAAAQLEISQALLSHYEKGIRECGLDFLCRCAEFYGVSCDYLLGRTPIPTGYTLTVNDIPDPDAAGKENVFKGSVLPILNKKLISNSLNILFDLMTRLGSESLIQEVSSFLMIGVYRAFRVIYSANPKNQEGIFSLPPVIASHYATAAMQICEGNAAAVASNRLLPNQQGLEDTQVSISTESLPQEYPLFSASLLNLVNHSEKTIQKMNLQLKKKG